MKACSGSWIRAGPEEIASKPKSKKVATRVRAKTLATEYEAAPGSPNPGEIAADEGSENVT